MDIRNVAVGVVMEVIATTIMLPVPEEETTAPTLSHDNVAIVAICPSTGLALDVSSQLRATTAHDSGLVFPVDQCEGPMSGGIGARAGTAIAV